MSKKTDTVKDIMKVAEHYKDGELYATGAMTDIGILLDDYEKSKVENLPISGVVLPCPFCGGNDLVFHKSKSPDGTVTWYHLHHGVTNECSVSFIHSDKEQLIELWNRRA